MVPASLLQHLESVLQTALAAGPEIRGGDIHTARMLQTADGRRLFLKFNRSAQAPAMFRTEAQGLALLGASRVIGAPHIHAYGEGPDNWAYLVLDFIAPGPRSRLFWQKFGEALANLHGNTSEKFGFAHDNFIGSLPQSNRRHDTWADFYAAERLLPQVRLARDGGYFDPGLVRQLEKLCSRIDRLCPVETPALVHGDLWSGNFLCNTDGEPVLIDPAAAFAHRETDLAMARLFGGFDEAFFTAYNQYWPLEPGFDERVEVYQLYYLLVHLNLFGEGYLGRVRDILKRFA